MSPAEQPDTTIADTRRGLIYHGYLPVPVLGKYPRIDGWQKLEPSLGDVDSLISQYPDHVSTGLKTGNLVAIDIDVTDENVSRLVQTRVAQIPNSSYALCRVGKSPKAMFFFRSSEPGKKKLTPFYLINEEKHRVEVMRAGQQVVAYGVHPDTKRPYEWIGDSPLDVEFDALPEIEDAEIDSFLIDAEAIMAQHGTKVEKEKKSAPVTQYEPTAQRAPAGDGIWAELKSRAMANLGTWVPDLGLSGTRTYQQGYKARADFRPSTSSKGKSGNARDLSVEFSPQGICDHADGNRGYNPIDIVATVFGCKPSDAADWLRERVGDEREHTNVRDLSGLIAGSKKREAQSSIDTDREVQQPDAPIAANDNNPTTPPRAKLDPYPGITSSGDLVRGFVPPDYHIDGVSQSGFLYSTTAMTGTGKTAVLLLITALTALGDPMGDYEVTQGRVLYFAGENPDDVTMRWIAMAHHMGFDPDDIDAHFIKGTFSIPQMFVRIKQDVERLGGVSMIVIDTSAAYFRGDDDNSNTQLGNHARELRQLTTLKGNPVVYVAAHPVKSADLTNLVPRGGGAFLNEVDGNLVLIKGDTGVKMHWHGKHRGVDFKPIMFGLDTVTAPALQDSKGRDVPTVMARLLSKGETRDMAATARNDRDEVLIRIENGDRHLVPIAESLGWKDKHGEPDKGRVRRATDKMKKLVKYDGAKWHLTTAGQEAATEARTRMHQSKSAAAFVARYEAKQR